MIVVSTLIILLLNKKNTLEDNLKKLGYNNSEIIEIKTLKVESINYILELEYNEIYAKLIEEEEFKEDNLIKYIDYYKQYKINPTSVIEIVNNNLESYIYKDFIIEIIHSKYYIQNRFERYYNYKNNHLDTSIESVIEIVNTNNDYTYYTTDFESNFNKGILVLVNKFYKADKFEPTNLVNIGASYGGNNHYIQDVAYEEYKKMYNDMKKVGLNLVIRSSYRSYTTQASLYNNYVARDGINAADTYSARSGYSEHQTGLAIDIGANSYSDLGDFEYTSEFNWISNNAYKYGFILRYPKDKQAITGYMYEPWHYRYVGVEAATYIHDNNITFDEYYSYFVEK